MLETNRPGVTASSSTRVQLTLVATRAPATIATGSASTFFDTNTRPVVVAAHAVDVSALVRSTAAIAPPARSPQATFVSVVGPSRAQSPHATVPVQKLHV